MSRATMRMCDICRAGLCINDAPRCFVGLALGVLQLPLVRLEAASRRRQPLLEMLSASSIVGGEEENIDDILIAFDVCDDCARLYTIEQMAKIINHHVVARDSVIQLHIEKQLEKHGEFQWTL